MNFKSLPVLFSLLTLLFAAFSHLNALAQKDSATAFLQLSSGDTAKVRAILADYAVTTNSPLTRTNTAILETSRLIAGYHLQQTNEIPPVAMKLVAMALYNCQDYSKAEEVMRKYTQQFANDPDGWSLQGTCQFMQHKTNDMLASWKQAAQLGYEPAQLHYAFACVTAGQLDEARRLLPQLQAIEESPASKTNYLNSPTLDNQITAFAILTTYAVHPDVENGKEIFLRAVKAIDLKRVVGMEDGQLRVLVQQGCQRFTGPEIRHLRYEYQAALSEVKNGADHSPNEHP